MTPAQHVRGPFRRASSMNAGGSAPRLAVPFDHAASFELKGVPGNIVQDVINISSDSSFVAVGISYGFEEDRARPAPLDPLPPDPFVPGTVKLSQIPTAALIEGFRINPRFERLIFNDDPLSARGRNVSNRERTFSNVPLAASSAATIVERLKPVEEISFLFSIVDSATRRELQDEPIHNLASLGKSNGERPFRMLAQPLTFQPRSTVRLQIIERSEGLQGTLFIVLYGFKTGGPGAQEAINPFIAEPQSSRVIPFDYVTSFSLSGSPGNQLEEEIPVNAEGGFVATSIGYGLAVDSLDISLNGLTIASSTGNVNLGTAVTLANFPTSALQDGIRIRPNFLRIAFDNDGVLSSSLSPAVVSRLFERLNRPEDVSFRYSIFDAGAGRELQNQPINNIAGLGIANGDRPFKRFAQPLMFGPRSTIRVTVEELFGRGTLFIVFQGYKILASIAASQPQFSGRRARRR
jgi:hypothetical protein